MCKKIKLVMMLVTCLGISANCFSADTARLFMAQKGDHIAFFLPVFHVTTNLEKDNYLPTVIEEVFRRTTALYDESAHKSHIYPYALHPCAKKIQLPAKVQKKLDKKYSEIVSYDTYRFPAPDLIQEKDFVKLMVVMFGPIHEDEKNLPPGYVLHKGQVSTVLAKKYGVGRNSIEGMHEFHRSYCELSEQERISTINDALRDFGNINQQGESFKTKLYKKVLESTILSMSVPISDQSVALHSGEKAGKNFFTNDLDRFVLFNRNQIWLSKIIQMSSEPGIPFYAFGAAHFTANKFGPGLISLLRQAGFEISLIKSLSDLPPNFMSRPAALQVDENIKVAQKNSPN